MYLLLLIFFHPSKNLEEHPAVSIICTWMGIKKTLVSLGSISISDDFLLKKIHFSWFNHVQTPFLLIFFPFLLLVGGFNPSEKYEFVSWDDDIPN